MRRENWGWLMHQIDVKHLGLFEKYTYLIQSNKTEIHNIYPLNGFFIGEFIRTKTMN